MIQISKPFLGDKEINAAVEVLKSGNLSQGPKVKEFEEMFAKYCGTKYAVAVNNGTSALHCILFAFGVQPGEEVITTPFTFVATANSIIMQGARPIFADISEEDFNIDPVSVESRITEKTRAIMPVDLYGQIYNVEAISEIAKKHNLKVAEDACQSVAAEYKGEKAGLLGDAAAFSLYATKNITAGIGGMITTNDEEIMKKCKLFRHHGQDEATQYDYIIFGYNYRMMDAIAAIGIEQLKRIDELTDARAKNAQKLLAELQGIPGLILPKVKEGFKHVWHQFTIRITPEFKMIRDEFIERMLEKDIQCKIYYPKPLHLYPQFENYGYKEGDCPVAEKLALEVVSLPVHPLVKEEEIEHIIKIIKNL
jgi:perosamine synthetase